MAGKPWKVNLHTKEELLNNPFSAFVVNTIPIISFSQQCENVRVIMIPFNLQSLICSCVVHLIFVATS